MRQLSAPLRFVALGAVLLAIPFQGPAPLRGYPEAKAPAEIVTDVRERLRVLLGL